MHEGDVMPLVASHNTVRTWGRHVLDRQLMASAYCCSIWKQSSFALRSHPTGCSLLLRVFLAPFMQVRMKFDVESTEFLSLHAHLQFLHCCLVLCFLLVRRCA